MEWWNTLHQPASVGKIGAPSIHPTMLIPLLLMGLSFKLYYATITLMRMRNLILQRERYASWINDAIKANP